MSFDMLASMWHVHIARSPGLPMPWAANPTLRGAHMDSGYTNAVRGEW